MNSSSVSQNVKRIIKDKGMLQYAVADRAGYSRGAFNAMLNGSKKQYPTLTLFALLLCWMSPQTIYLALARKSAAS